MKDALTIVPAGLEDLPVISALAPEIWRYAYEGILSAAQIDYMLNWMYSPEKLRTDYKEGVKFRLIKHQEKAVGFFAYFECPENRSVLKLDKLYLSPAFHGQGVGQMVLDHLSGCASDAGYTALKLNVNKANKRAVTAYTRNGFKKKESVKVDIGSGFFMDDYVMEKKLM